MDRPEGKLILKTLPDEEARKAVIVYLSKLFKTVPQEKIVALLQTMPVVLSHNVPANVAQKVITDLQKFGASAIYMPQTASKPGPPQPTPAHKKNVQQRQSGRSMKSQKPGSSQKKHIPKPRPKKPGQVKTSSKATPYQKKKKQHSRIEELRESILDAFHGKLPRGSVSLFYKIGLFLVMWVMLILPLIYLAMIGGVGYLMYWHAFKNPAVTQEGRNVFGILFVYVLPLLIGGVLIFFMIKPLFVRLATAFKPFKLYRQDEPLLFAFIEKICTAVGAPIPEEIHVLLDVNASAGFRHGIWSFWGHEMVLTVGLPLVAGLSVEQLAGVLAHEFGHFAQKTGMRLSYIVRSISFWFARVVYQEDEWDFQLRHWSERANFHIAIFLLIIRFFIWFTRRVLWLLMIIGNMFSCFLLRQMEYDADRYETYLEGTQGFEFTSRRLIELSLAYQGAFHDLENSWEEGRLVDNVPALILANEKQIPEDVLKKVLKAEFTEARTGFFDTHPSTKDRVEAAKALNAEALFAPNFSHPALQKYAEQREGAGETDKAQPFLPASLLFRDFEGLARKVSLTFYRKFLGKQVTSKHLVSTDTIVEKYDQETEYFNALDRVFQGQFNALRPLKLGESPLRAPSNPQEIVQKIKSSRKEIRSLSKEYTRMLKTFYKQDDRLIELAQIQALIDAGFRIDYRKYHLPSGDIKTVEESYEKALRRQQQLSDQKLRPFEQHVHTRISGALRLLALPQVISKLKNGQSLKQDTEQFMDIANLFEIQLPTLQDLYQVYQQLLVLVQHIEGNEDHPVLTEAIHSTMNEVYDLLASLKKQLGGTAYPFSHTQQNITLGDFVIQQLPEENNLGALFEVTQSILDKFSRVYARLIARLAHSAEIVEELVGLPRLPEPPKK